MEGLPGNGVREVAQLRRELLAEGRLIGASD
jgi:hypothetical protein